MRYGRKNAPNVRYLPRELTVKFRYDDFVLRNQNVCKLEVYRQTLKQMNVSLRQPKSDQCEDCAFFKQSLENDLNEDIEIQLTSHRAKAEQANLEYKKKL